MSAAEIPDMRYGLQKQERHPSTRFLCHAIAANEAAPTSFKLNSFESLGKNLFSLRLGGSMG